VSLTNPQPRVARTWSTFQLTVKGRPLVALINAAYREFPSKADFPWCLLVSIPLANPIPAGVSTREDSEALERFQQRVIRPILDRTCPHHFIGRTTHGGHRDLFFYVDDPAQVVLALNELCESGTERTFTFGCERDEQWSIVERYLRATEPRPARRFPWFRR
jgi:uncharacterized protein DUF695